MSVRCTSTAPKPVGTRQFTPLSRGNRKDSVPACRRPALRKSSTETEPRCRIGAALFVAVVRPPTRCDAKVTETIMSVMPPTARRLFELLEPICLVTYFADECNEELAAI